MPPAFGVMITFPKRGQAMAASMMVAPMVEEAIGDALDPILTAVFDESQIQVPQGETGHLKDSGKKNPFKKHGHKIKASITYGGGPHNVDYATVQHETPPGTYSGKGRRFSHTAPQKWKYLEDPAKAQKKNFKRAIKASGRQGINMAMLGAGYRKVLNVWR